MPTSMRRQVLIGLAERVLHPVRLLQTGAIPHKALCVVEEGGQALTCEAGKPMTGAQVARLHRLARQRKLPGIDTVELEQSIPFVPFIVGGAMLTAFFAGSLVPPLTGLVGWLGG